MPVKFNQYWRIIHDRYADYGTFIIKEFIPGINQLGIHTVAGWSVAVGGYSEIIFEGVTADLNLLEEALRNVEYKKLHDNLLNYVKNYKNKVLVSNSSAESYSMDIKENTVKFTQTWDVISSKNTDYEKFIAQEFFPCLEQLGIQVAGEWEVLIGDGPRTICEGRANDISSIIPSLHGPIFKKAKHGLKQFVENYESRLLSFHIQKVKGYKSASYNLIPD